MQFAKPLIIVASLLSAASAIAVGDATNEVDIAKLKRDLDTYSLSKRDVGSASGVSPFEPLTKRACVKNGCKCNKVKQGQYCGMCDAVTEAGGQGALYGTDIYECSPTGACCWYGPSSTCSGSTTNDRKYCPK